MSRPTHQDLAGSRYLALRALARATGRSTAELLQLYALEGFLARLASSPQRERLVLKGGVLLAALDARRSLGLSSRARSPARSGAQRRWRGSEGHARKGGRLDSNREGRCSRPGITKTPILAFARIGVSGLYFEWSG